MIVVGIIIQLYQCISVSYRSLYYPIYCNCAAAAPSPASSPATLPSPTTSTQPLPALVSNSVLIIPHISHIQAPRGAQRMMIEHVTPVTGTTCCFEHSLIAFSRIIAPKSIPYFLLDYYFAPVPSSSSYYSSTYGVQEMMLVKKAAELLSSLP